MVASCPTAGGGAGAPEVASVPAIAADARFVAFAEARGSPHAVVDCRGQSGTSLALSHHPGAGTPARLAADTSAAIVDRYLAADRTGPAIAAVTNDHYDEDGLFAIWLLLDRPAPGSIERRRAIAAAAAGDFQTWSEPAAVWSALAAMAMVERTTTPFSAVKAALARPAGDDPVATLYAAMLPRVGGLLTDPERYARYWRPGWERILADVALVDSGGVSIAEEPAADVCVVRAPRPLSPYAIHPRTDRMRILSAPADGRLVLTHRYETWVDYVSRPLAPRADLAFALGRLQAIEPNPGRWRCDDLDLPTPRLFLADRAGAPAPSGLAPEQVTAELAIAAAWAADRAQAGG